ncbi:MAG: hypothetical protein M3N39_05550 [Pseudomonadota bacterium]|nr:hypothetical protein [Pseudomonadota bacterium]
MVVPDPGRLSFRRYIRTRKYHHGRGSDEGWAFVALAMGDPNLPDVQGWQELRGYLVERGHENRIVEGARSVWRSYGSYLSRKRKLSRTTAFDSWRPAAYAGCNAKGR